MTQNLLEIGTDSFLNSKNCAKRLLLFSLSLVLSWPSPLTHLSTSTWIIITLDLKFSFHSTSKNGIKLSFWYLTSKRKWTNTYLIRIISHCYWNYSNYRKYHQKGFTGHWQIRHLSVIIRFIINQPACCLLSRQFFSPRMF